MGYKEKLREKQAKVTGTNPRRPCAAVLRRAGLKCRAEA